MVFYKNTCPTCRLAFPFLQALHDHVSPFGGRVVGVSQDGIEGTASFAAELGLTMPLAIDGDGYPVSRDYDLISVPTLYLLEADGTIVQSGAGFSKDGLGSMAGALAASVGATRKDLFGGHESTPAFKPG